jgi:glycerol-3-phosphate acyltransferase PlsX
MRIALDAMGGDNGSLCLVEGARMALTQDRDLEVALVGDRQALGACIAQAGGMPENRHEIIHASQVADMHVPAKASLKLKDSSILVGARLVKDKRAAGLVSAGNTAAASAATLTTWRPLSGIHRPAIATHLPTRKGPCIFLDMGGTVDCRPRNLAQFAIMGNVYAREVLGIRDPRIGILSVGEEESKGNELTIETYKLLAQAKDLNFRGNAEGRDILSGNFDVVVTDGFVGNVVLKFAESLAAFMMEEFRGLIHSNPLTMLLGLAIRPRARALKKKIDYAEYGGAPLLGLNGYCIICHGRSSALAICNALKVAKQFATHDVNVHIQEDVELNRHILNGSK